MRRIESVGAVEKARAHVAGWLLLVALALPACRENVTVSAAPARREAAPAHAETAGYNLRDEERRAVDAFLERNRHLRVATDGDRREPEDGETEVQTLYGLYHPYFVRGDVNDDGLIDFVLAFVRRDSERERPWFTVVIFTGREKPGGRDFGGETLLEKDISLADGDLSVDRDAVLITPDLQQESARRYRWDPVRRTYVFVREGEPEEETAPQLQET